MQSKKVLDLTKKIPKGKVSTYGQIARKLKLNPRVVGKILSKNPKLIKIPCHRIVCSNGSLGGYKLGINKKIRLLKKEGIEINLKSKKIRNFEKILFQFK